MAVAWGGVGGVAGGVCWVGREGVGLWSLLGGGGLRLGSFGEGEGGGFDGLLCWSCGCARRDAGKETIASATVATMSLAEEVCFT